MEMPPVFKSIPYYISASDPSKLQSYSGMAVAASNQNVVALGVTVTQGEGNLPKLLLTSDHGSLERHGVSMVEGYKGIEPRRRRKAKTWCFNGK